MNYTSLRQRSTCRPLFSLCALLCLVSLLLAACGGTTPTTEGTAGEETGERTIKHAMGETKVPANPQRVVVLDTGELDAALTLGIKPVGAVTALQDGPFLTQFADQVDGIEVVGTIAQPNLEKILELEPDLILSSKMRHEELYDKLSEIAPTVFAEKVGVVWKENFLLYADALNKKAEAEATLQKYYDRLEEFKTQMGDKLAEQTVSIVRVLPDNIRLYANGSFVGTILKDAGLPRPESQTAEDKTFVEVTSYESIPQMDGDIIFLMQYGNSQARLEELQKQPQWQQLTAAKNNKVFVVNDDYWATGIGMTSANLIVEDLFKYVAQ